MKKGGVYGKLLDRTDDCVSYREPLWEFHYYLNYIVIVRSHSHIYDVSFKGSIAKM